MTTLKSERSFSIKDADLLIVCATIVENALSQKDFLLSKRKNWADPYFSELSSRIDHAIQTNLGFDNAKELRGATQKVLQVQAAAVKDLASCKVQIVEDFKKMPERRAEILKVLGFEMYRGITKNGNQQDLVGHLYQFKTNMTEALKNEVVDRGTDEGLINAILGYADFLHTANVAQETLKAAKPHQTANAVDELNQIYSDVIGVCKIASKLAWPDPAKSNLFVFAKVARQISGKPNPESTLKKNKKDQE